MIENRISRWFRILLLPLALLAAAQVWSQETASTNRATDLKAEPRPDAATVVQLPRDATITILQRQSGWMRVQFDPGKKVGWVRAFHVQFRGTVSESGSSGGSSFFSFLRGPQSAPSKQTATIGIRGLTEAELANAHPNPAEFARMKGYMVSRSDADAFGKRNKLTPNAVDYVDANGRPQGGRK